MSSTDIAVQDQAPAPAPAKLEESASDLQFRQLIRRMQVTAPTLARMPGLNKSLVVSSGSGSNKVVDWEATRANVEVVGFTLATYGIALNAVNVQQFDIIQGTLTPRCQLQMGIVTQLTGHAISLDPSSDEHSATAVLVRADNGERHEATYTVDQARASGALDFWVERWENRRVEKVVLGETEAEARAAQAAHPMAWVKSEGIKSLEAWHKYRADMLARRALKRVMRWGAPEVVSGVVSLRERFPEAIVTQLAPNTAKATVAIDMGLDDGDDPEISAMGDRPALPAAAAVQAVRGFAARVIRLHHQINALPESWQRPLLLAWAAKSLPVLESDDFMPIHLDEAESIVDKITAEALRQAPGTQMAAAAKPEPEMVGSALPPEGHPARPHEGDGAGPSADRQAASQPPSSSEPARPLAQQIAMQAREGGIDWHHVVAAVTCGEKTSSKELDAEEGELVLKAIADIRAGLLVLVEKADGWHFERATPGQSTTFDQGQVFE